MNRPETAAPPSALAGLAPGRSLRGRRGECEVLDRLVANVRACHSRVLVLRGEAGAGKTALLEYLVQHAVGCRVARAAGAEPEMEMAFAGLHQLCAPFLDRLGRLPDPQRDALGTAFSLRNGEVPDRFAVGLAALSLLSEVAGDQPLVCAALTAGRLATRGILQVAGAARGAPRAPEPPRAANLLLDGLAVLTTEGHAAGAPMVKRALSAFRDQGASAEEAFRWLPFACRMSRDAWDDESWDVLSTRLIERARQAGALTVLPAALLEGAAVRLAVGEPAKAASMTQEAAAVARATGNPVGPCGGCRRPPAPPPLTGRSGSRPAPGHC